MLLNDSRDSCGHDFSDTRETNGDILGLLYNLSYLNSKHLSVITLNGI